MSANPHQLDAECLAAENLPPGCVAFPFYPEGVHVPVPNLPWAVDGPAEDEGDIILTEDGDDETVVVFGVYDRDGDGAMFPVYRTKIAELVTYLLDPPEGVNWFAWAKQRLDDDEGVYVKGVTP